MGLEISFRDGSGLSAYLCGNADGGGVRGNVFNDHGVCADECASAHVHWTEDPRSGTNDDSVTEGRVAFFLDEARATESDAVVQHDIVAHVSGFTNDNAHAVIDKKPPSDCCTRVDFYSRCGAGELGKCACGEAMLAHPQGVGEPVRPHGVQSRVQQGGFQAAAGGRIAMTRSLNVLARMLDGSPQVGCHGYARRPYAVQARAGGRVVDKPH